MISEERRRLGEIIKEARERAALSRVELAELLGTQSPVIYKYEDGDIVVIPFEKRIKMAKILNIDLVKLLYENELELIEFFEITKGR